MDNLSTVDKFAGPNVSFIKMSHCILMSAFVNPVPLHLSKPFSRVISVHNITSMYICTYVRNNDLNSCSNLLCGGWLGVGGCVGVGVGVGVYVLFVCVCVCVCVCDVGGCWSVGVHTFVLSCMCVVLPMLMWSLHLLFLCTRSCSLTSPCGPHPQFSARVQP